MGSGNSDPVEVMAESLVVQTSSCANWIGFWLQLPSLVRSLLFLPLLVF